MINGHEVTVRSNLEAALRSFRQQDEFQGGLMLWTDALCINQDDINEKEKTIQDMQNIYLRDASGQVTSYRSGMH